MKQQFLAMIDKKIEKYQNDSPLKELATYTRAIKLFQELRSDVEKMDSGWILFLEEGVEDNLADGATIVCTDGKGFYALADVDDGTLVFDDEYSGLHDFTHYQIISPPIK